jgi:glycosyltransferase involved in cell wall biosynthesis
VATDQSKGSASADAVEAHRTIVITANSSWNIVNFRAGLISALIQAGYPVVVIAPDEGRNAERIEELGATFVSIRLRGSGLSPIEDARLLRDYLRLFRTLRPFAMLGYTIKPNIYGSIAAGIMGVRAINNISGLGTAFLRRGPLQWLATSLYRRALRRSHLVFFQNRDDRELFLDRRLVRQSRTRLLPGSGVDLNHFAPRSARQDDGEFRFLLIARMLWDKGVGEFVDAARLLRARHPHARFQLLGFVGADNRSAVPAATLDAWVAEGIVEYLGETDDVRDAIAQSGCVVLPSYREGLPRSLIEAAAMGKPVVTTDVPGCRDAIAAGKTGLLCEVRSAASLAAAMEGMMAMPAAERQTMGRCARERAERTFDQRLIIDAYLDALAQ